MTSNRKIKKKKIAIFQYDLGVGGIQRSLINLLASLDHSKYEIDLYLVNNENFFEEDLPKEVNVKKLTKLPEYTKLLPFRLVKVLYGRQLSSSAQVYDVSIDFNGYQSATALGALYTKSSKKIIWIHSDYKGRMKFDRSFRLSYMLQKSKFKLFDNIAVVSDGLLEVVSSMLDVPSSGIQVVNNYIDTESIHLRSGEDVKFRVSDGKFNLITVSRLVKVKGVDEILHTIHEVVKNRCDIHLYIVGGGIEEVNLRRLSEELGLSSYVTFLGYQSNPYSYMRLMDGFISMSRYEGQGISTLEAKSLGLQIFIPKRLEKFSYGVQGRLDVAGDIVQAKKIPKIIDLLENYNNDVLRSFDSLVS